MLTLDKIYHAAYALSDVVRKTSLVRAPKLNPDCDVYLKTENLQVTGSFKLRGAYFKISRLNEEERAAGIVACSAGNHAQGVALASSRRSAEENLVLPARHEYSLSRLGYPDGLTSLVNIAELNGHLLYPPYLPARPLPPGRG